MTIDPAPPADFAPLGFRSGFMDLIGPAFVRDDGATLTLGLRLRDAHANNAGVAHGGLLTAFADVVLAAGTIYHARLDHRLVTVSLSCDFLAPVAVGAWLEGSANLLRRTRTMVFGEAHLRVDGACVLRASAALKIGPAAPQDWYRRDGRAA